MSVAVLREFQADSRMEARRTRKAHLAPSRHQFELGALSELSASLTNRGPGVVLSAVAAHPSQPDPMVSISRYRDRAEEFRRIAENHPYREGFLRLAATWDVLAECALALGRASGRAGDRRKFKLADYRSGAPGRVSGANA